MPVQNNDYPQQSAVERTATTDSPDTVLEFDPTDGSVVVDFNPEEVQEGVGIATEDGFYGNLAESLDDEELEAIGDKVHSAFEADKESRAEWEVMFDKGFDLLGLRLEETSEPFEGAATAVHPLLIESAVKFQSKASSELLPASGPVKTQIIGEQTPEKSDQANRIKNFMNYQITEQMSEYFDEAERMLFHLPIMGSAIKKTYYDEGLERNVSEFVPLDQFYVSNFASNLDKADRYTQVIYRSPVDMERNIAEGTYKDCGLGNAALPELGAMGDKMNLIMGLAPSAEFDPQYTLLEQHCYLEIEGDDDDSGLKQLPYIVTIEEKTQKVLSIRRNYDAEDKRRIKKQFFTHYKFVPGFGFYGLGLIHFLGNLTMSATSAMRSLLDAGQFATLPAGFKAKGVRISGDNDPIAPGEFKEVEATGMDLSKSIVPLPYKEPSSTLFQMLQFVASTGQKFADSTEQVVNDGASYGPVGTTMALLEASGKFFSAIHKRLHHAQRCELKILARLNYEYLPTTYPYALPNGQGEVLKKDFDGKVDVIPVSDPNIPSNAHRMMMSQMAMDIAGKSPPGMFNMEELNRTILQSANLPNLDRILPKKPEAQLSDPVTDIVAATKGMPIKAFSGQDHQSHIQVKMAYLQDPINGANPIMQRLQPVLSANIQEHSVLAYQEQMAGTVSSITQQNPEAAAMAQQQAAAMVLEANKQKATGQADSPEQQMVKMEAQRLQLEDKKINAQMAKENASTILADRKLDIEENKLALAAYEAGANLNFKADEAEKKREHQKLLEAVKIITDLMGSKDDRDQEEKMKVMDTMSKSLLEQQKGN